MQKTYDKVYDFLIAFALAALIFFVSVMMAQKILDSSIYKQSRIVSMLVQQESISLAGLLENTRDADVVVKFAGALASGYINFELIPVNEVSTFVAVFESLPDGVSVEEFGYRRKDLTITGTAPDTGEYRDFITALKKRERFASVSGSHFEGVDGLVHFKIVCASNVVEAFLDFAQF